MDLVLYVFTQADLFSDIGDASVETSPLLPHAETPGLYLLRLTLAGGKIETARDKARVPVDADRHIAAVYMAMLMARFVWMHELFHCVGGHVAYLAHHGHEAGLDELPQGLGLVGFKPEQSIVTPEIKKCFEFEADAQALKACCEIQIAGHENMGGIAAMGFKTRFEMTIMGAYLMTWLFDEYERFAQSQNGSTHPLPQERLQHLIKSVHSTYAHEIDGFDIFHQSIVDQFNLLMTRLGSNISVEIAQCLNLPNLMNTNEMVRSFAFQISV
jgi:hypothetical protein